jgi:hypothetical protein
MIMVCLALAACAGVAPTTTPAPSVARPAPAAHSDGADERWKQRASVAGCRDALVELARVDLAAFHGLGTCGRIDAERAFGSSGDQPSRFEQFGEYRVYTYGGSSVLVWFLTDNIRVVQLLYPKLPRPLAPLLGAPDAKAPSQLSPSWEQWIYADRGLAAHVKPATGEVVTLFAFQPTSVAQFLETDIARVSKSEAPIEELK